MPPYVVRCQAIRMTKPPSKRTHAARAPREPVTRERALHAAVSIADAEGLDGLTMRRLASALGVEAMSLYHHVPNKDAILDGMVDHVFSEIDTPRANRDWKAELRRRTRSMREALLRHRWALRVLETRKSPGHLTLTHHDAVIGCLRSAGFSIPLTARAYALVDAYVFGFVHTEISLPTEVIEDTGAFATELVRAFPEGAYPHLAELAEKHVMKPGYSYGREFDFGLDLVLDGLGRELAKAQTRRPKGPARKTR